MGKRTPTYRSWLHMRERCNWPKHHKYKWYGARGIKVCERWNNSFANFLADMGECPAGMSIDRKDVNGNYEPSNCRWASLKTQAQNTTKTVYVTAFGETKCAREWSRDSRCAVAYGVLWRRVVRKSWDHELAITTPAEAKK